MAAHHFGLSDVDLSEIARRSVLQSGFSAETKRKWLGDTASSSPHNASSSLFHCNNSKRTNVPRQRLRYRDKVLAQESQFLELIRMRGLADAQSGEQGCSAFKRVGERRQQSMLLSNQETYTGIKLAYRRERSAKDQVRSADFRNVFLLCSPLSRKDLNLALNMGQIYAYFFFYHSLHQEDHRDCVVKLRVAKKLREKYVSILETSSVRTVESKLAQSFPNQQSNSHSSRLVPRMSPEGLCVLVAETNDGNQKRADLSSSIDETSPNARAQALLDTPLRQTGARELPCDQDALIDSQHCLRDLPSAQEFAEVGFPPAHVSDYTAICWYTSGPRTADEPHRLWEYSGYTHYWRQDLAFVLELTKDTMLNELCGVRLRLMEARYNYHVLMNSRKEADAVRFSTLDHTKVYIQISRNQPIAHLSSFRLARPLLQ